MPNHVHMLILPHVPLPQITHWIKGRTAREANLLLERTGEPFWLGGSSTGLWRMFRQGWRALPRVGHSQAPHRQAKACPTGASTLGKLGLLLDFFDLRGVAGGM